MKPSDAAELAGFGLVSLAAWLILPIAGLFVAGFSLIFIGWALEDDQVTVRLSRLTSMVSHSRAHRKGLRAQKRAARRLRRGDRFTHGE